MRVKVDEDLPVSIALLLRQRGIDSATVIDEGLGGCKDAVLWDAVQTEGRFLITADKGFGDVRLYSPGTHPGGLLLRPDEDGVQPMLELVTAVIKQHDLTTLAGCLVVATPRGVRVRRARAD